MPKTTGNTGTKIPLDAMPKDKALARLVPDALDGEVTAGGAQTSLISSVLLPDGQTRCKFTEVLLERGSNVNHQDGNRRTALSHACEKGYLDAVKILVRSGADPEIMDSWGNTPLMYAAAADQTSVVEFLVRAFKRLGLQIDGQNQAGNSAVEVAKFLGHTECISALSGLSKRSRTAHKDRFDRKVDSLSGKLEVLRVCERAEVCYGFPVPQLEREDKDSCSGSQGINSAVRAPAPGSGKHSHPLSKLCIIEENMPSSTHHLPPLQNGRDVEKSMFFSPQQNRNMPHSFAPSALGILLTPILPKKCETEKGREKSFRVRRFNECYYKKRCSLPNSALSPTPPERTQVPARKFRTSRRSKESASFTEPLHFNTASTGTTFSALTNKLFRRFTSPEFNKDVGDPEQNQVPNVGRIPRSETFPQDARHQQVDSTPSINSISSVKCEFDFQLRKTNS